MAVTKANRQGGAWGGPRANSGGYRPGAGRKPGGGGRGSPGGRKKSGAALVQRPDTSVREAINNRTPPRDRAVIEAINQAVLAAAAQNQTPLEYMLAVFRDPTADLRRRDSMAQAAAPYIHARLALTAVSIEDRTGHEAALDALEAEAVVLEIEGHTSDVPGAGGAPEEPDDEPGP
jgi:hypothetical protein